MPGFRSQEIVYNHVAISVVAFEGMHIIFRIGYFFPDRVTMCGLLFRRLVLKFKKALQIVALSRKYDQILVDGLLIQKIVCMLVMWRAAPDWRDDAYPEADTPLSVLSCNWHKDSRQISRQ
jgi:hypothetical protein